MATKAIFTVEEINQHIDHYNVYKTLPVEVMEKLFGIALANAVLTSKDPAASFKEVDAMLDAKAAEAGEAPAAKPTRRKQKGE